MTRDSTADRGFAVAHDVREDGRLRPPRAVHVETLLVGRVRAPVRAAVAEVHRQRARARLVDETREELAHERRVAVAVGVAEGVVLLVAVASRRADERPCELRPERPPVDRAGARRDRRGAGEADEQHQPDPLERRLPAFAAHKERSAKAGASAP